MILEALELHVEGGRVRPPYGQGRPPYGQGRPPYGQGRPPYGQGRYGVVPPLAPDIIIISVPRRFPPNAASVEKSWRRTFRCTHQGVTCTPPSANHV